MRNARNGEPPIAYWIRQLHPSILFFIGVGGIMYETLETSIDRPYLLAVFAAMAGVLPASMFDAILGRRGSADGESNQTGTKKSAH
jgi:hypothetical protein